MKKIICLMLAMLVMMSCTLPVFADTESAQKAWDSNFIDPIDIKYPMSVSSLLSCAGQLGVLKGDKVFLYHYNSEDYGGTRYRDVYVLYTSPDPDCYISYNSVTNKITFNGTCYGALFQTDYDHNKGEFTKYHPKLVSNLGNVDAKPQSFYKFNPFGITLLKNDFDVLDFSTGDALDGSGNITSEEFFYDFEYDEDYNCNMKVSTTGKKDYFVGFTLSNKDGVHLPYSFFGSNGRYSLSKSQPVEVSWNVKQFYDDFQDVPDYTDDVIIGVSVSTYSEEDDRYNIVDFHIEKINIQDILSQDHSLFAEKKDYVEFPDIDDYIQEFPDFPTWDSDHPLDSIWNIVKWVGDCLIVVGKNLIGLIKWLGACLWTIIENIGIALYNLVVDIRRLLIYLFVPDSTKLQNLIKDKFPALLKIESSIKAGQNSNSNTSINLFGHSFDFDFSDMPDSIKSFMYTGSTIFLYATQVFMIAKMAMKFFGVSAGGEEE